MPPITKTEMEKKIKELEDKVAEMQDELNKLKQVKTDEPKKWKPELDEDYYFVNDCGRVGVNSWDNDIADSWRYLNDNVFKTAIEAEEHKKKLEIQADFKNFVEDRTDKLNWNDGNESKCYIYKYNNGIDIGYDWTCKTQGTIYASSEQILRDAVAEIGEENVKKYVLEVE